MRDFYRLIKRLGTCRKYFFLLILRSPFDALRAWMLAGLMKTTFLCIETMDARKLLVQCVLYGLICAVLFFYNGTIWSIYAAFAAKTEAQLQRMFFNKVINMSYRCVERHSGGEWFTKLNSDVHAAFMMMNGPLNIPHAVVAILNMTLSSCLLFRSSKEIFMVVLVFVIPHLVLNYQMVLKPMPRLKEKSQDALAESTAMIDPLITQAESIFIYHADELLLKQCEERSRRLIEINMNMHMRSAFSNATLCLFGIGGYLVILGLGYSAIYDGELIFAELVYSFQIRGSVLAATMMLITCINNIKANSICIKRINDTLEE